MINRGWRLLLTCCLVIGFTWLVVLPWIGELGPVRRTIERNEAAGIDPSAMFYTDLEHLSYDDGMLRRE